MYRYVNNYKVRHVKARDMEIGIVSEMIKLQVFIHDYKDIYKCNIAQSFQYYNYVFSGLMLMSFTALAGQLV